MTDPRDLLERVGGRFSFPDQAFERMLRRRDRRRRNQRLAAGAVGVGIAIAAFAIGASVLRSSSLPADHVPSPTIRMHNGSIDVYGFTNGVRELGADGMGTHVVRCSGSCTETAAASWSPDGALLAFSAACGGGCGSANDPYHGIRVFDPARGSDRLILAGEGIHALAWSPDGTRIAYETSDHIGVVTADGSGTVDLVLGIVRPSIDLTVTWSADGSRVAYSDQGSIWIVGLDGSEPIELAKGTNPAWSADGRTIAYLNGCEIRTISPDGSDDRPLVDLAASRPDAATCDQAVGLVWSPDGAKLAAMVDRDVTDLDTPSRRGVFVVDGDGSDAHLISRWSHEPYWGLAWQPVP